MRGGYHIVNFRETEPSEEGVTVNGVYESLEGNYHKAIMVTGIVLESVVQRDQFVEVTLSGTDYTFTAYGKTFTITDADLVKVA